MSSNLNGCHDRPPLLPLVMVQDGWEYSASTRIPVMKVIPDPMDKQCVYSIRTKHDLKCEGCKWKQI